MVSSSQERDIQQPTTSSSSSSSSSSTSTAVMAHAPLLPLASTPGQLTPSMGQLSTMTATNAFVLSLFETEHKLKTCQTTMRAKFDEERKRVAEIIHYYEEEG